MSTKASGTRTKKRAAPSSKRRVKTIPVEPALMQEPAHAPAVHLEPPLAKPFFAPHCSRCHSMPMSPAALVSILTVFLVAMSVLLVEALDAVSFL